MRLAVVLLIPAVLASCGKSDEDAVAPPAAKGGGLPRVFVANYPLAYFAQRVGGHEIEVVWEAPRDEDPAFWQPSDAQITAYQGADLILMNGAGYSKWAEKATLPESRLVDTSAAFRDRFIVTKGATTHSHGKQGEHSHEGVAFTTWLDFQQAIAQADAVCEALKKLKPEAIEQFALNADALRKDLLALDARLVAVGKKLEGQPLVASHPVYQYWARRYGFKVEAVLWEPEEIPTAAQIEDLRKLLAARPARRMIWEGEPATESVEKLRALGLDSLVFDPCGNTPDQGDFLSVMRTNVEKLERAAGAIPP